MSNPSLAQVALLEAMQRGTTLVKQRMDGRHKAQMRILRSDNAEDVTSLANALRDRGYLRADYSLAKSGRKASGLP
jgi:hypothetical protein